VRDPRRVRRGSGRLLVGLVLELSALASLASAPTGSRLLFAGGTAVPRPVQEFAWQVIETHCDYQPYERERRSFWA
jgi:hypothetical protein